MGDLTKSLSYFTNRENNLMKVTSQCVFKKDEAANNIDLSKSKMREFLNRTSQSIREAKFKLSKIVDSGEVHIVLSQASPY